LTSLDKCQEFFPANVIGAGLPMYALLHRQINILKNKQNDSKRINTKYFQSKKIVNPGART
jgi:hypothetical protein